MTQVSPPVSAPPSRPKAPPPTPLEACPRCGADIRGGKSSRCPGCGIDVVTAVRFRESDRAARVHTAVFWRRTALLAVVCYSVLGATLLLFGDPGDIEWFVLRQAVVVPVFAVIYWTCSAFWLGFEIPFAASVVRLGCVACAGDMVGFIMWNVPALYLNQLFTSLAIMLLSVRFLRLEYQEGLVVGLLLAGARYITHVSLATWGS